MRVRRRKAGIAGILGAILMFAMLFTIGTGFFIYINSGNLVYSQALTGRTNAANSQVLEQAALAASPNANGQLVLTVTDTGGVSLVINDIFVLIPSNVLCTFGVGVASNSNCPNTATNTTPPLPIAVSPSTTSAAINTGITIASGTYILRVLTASGNTYTATYPPSGGSPVTNALASGAIGDLYLTFDSFTIYTVTSHGSTSGCPAKAGTNSGYCLETGSGFSGPGFAVPGATYDGRKVGFSATFTNLNQGQADIILDQWSLMYAQVPSGANAKVPLISWNIISVGSPSGNFIPISNQYTPVVLNYNKPITIYFMSANCVQAAVGPDDGCSTVSSQGTNDYVGCPCSSNYPSASTIFLMSNGWKLAPGSYTVGTLLYSQANYGQNAPFVSTVYY